ncbi:DUF3037 domain-containing protein [Mucilaginibacter defluvii]|uniref:DUF3037 domain-containing protein n=1 Tax=Mucilaginibacter defluvii TaxID=1196019 RepID=A0ABP9FU11_9SPHI
MPEPQLFEYAVVRVVPRVEREEFINVGVILYCPKQKYLGFEYKLDADRLKALYSDLDIDELKHHFAAFEQISLGSKAGGPIGTLDVASRFRWLTATRSTVVQSSKTHPGLCDGDPAQKLKLLFEKLVL